MLLFIVPLAAWLYNQAADIASGVGDFLRSIPSYFAPKPMPLAPIYTPPFTGGQCVGVFYRVNWIVEVNFGSGWQTRDASKNDIEGPITAIFLKQPNAASTSISANITYKNGALGVIPYFGDFGNLTDAIRTVSLSVTRMDNAPDTCGNLGNPNPLPSIPDDGLFRPNNPYITDSNDVVNPSAIVLAPALPLVLVPLISSAIAAALSAARAAATALEAIQKVAEALEGLAELWKKLKEFLDEWEKNRPKKRDITRQTYGQILGDGALDFFAPNSKKVEAIQLDIIVTNIPKTRGKYFGSLSPHRYRYGMYNSERELGYIAFYSVNQGILEVHSIQFKRSTLQIPPLAVGFIYHFGLDEQTKAFAFGTFSIEKT